MTIECGLVLLTRVFNVFTLTKCYTCNTIHHKKTLYFFVVEKNNVHKNVKCSRFKCPYCNRPLRSRYFASVRSEKTSLHREPVHLKVGVVSKATVVLRRWGSSIQKFGFINGVDNVNWPPYRDSKS